MDEKKMDIKARDEFLFQETRRYKIKFKLFKNIKNKKWNNKEITSTAWFDLKRENIKKDNLLPFITMEWSLKNWVFGTNSDFQSIYLYNLMFRYFKLWIRLN